MVYNGWKFMKISRKIVINFPLAGNFRTHNPNYGRSNKHILVMHELQLDGSKHGIINTVYFRVEGDLQLNQIIVLLLCKNSFDDVLILSSTNIYHYSDCWPQIFRTAHQFTPSIRAKKCLKLFDLYGEIYGKLWN